jgi:hypothetical protein
LATKESELRPGLLPGHPGDPAWPHTLVLLGIDALSANPQTAPRERTRYAGLVQSLHSSLSVRPFGDRKRAIQAASDLWHWADELLQKKSHSPIDQGRATSLLVEACRIAQGPDLDYDSARQLAWAVQVLYTDIVAANPGARANPTIVSALKSLDDHLLLQLRSAKEQIEGSLKTRLDYTNKYVPFPVRKNLEQIRKEVQAGRLML